LSKCFRRDCKNFNDKIIVSGKIKIQPCENCCELFDDATECEYYLKAECADGINDLIIHNKCGLPVELCVCPDAEIKTL